MPQPTDLIRLESLAPLFHPRSIAVVGASSDPTKIGGRPIRNMQIAGWKGDLYPVNPNYPEIQGHKAFKSVSAIGAPVDMAVIVVPMPAVVAAAQACADAGVRSAIVISSGFAEIDDAGAREQEKLARIAADSGMRILGPNCMGTMNAHENMIATFASGIVDRGPEPGSISIASQSGAFGAHCFILARERGFGISLWATMGNQCDVDISDCLAYAATDPATKVVMGYIEGIREAPKFIAALEIARRERKPVVLMKVGRSEVGSAAAASHTASLTGSDAVFDALLRQYDVHRAQSIDEMFDVAYACSAGKFPAKRELGVITVSGGVGVIMADAAAEAGLDLPPLPAATQKRLKERVPFAGTRNPLDVTAQLINDTGMMTPMFEALLGDGGYSSAICFAAGLGLNPVLMERLMPSFEAIAGKFPDRLVALSIMSRPEGRRKLEELGYLVYEDPTRAIDSIAAVTRFGQAFARKGGPKAPPRLPKGAVMVEAGRDYNEVEAKRMLHAAGVPAIDERIVTSAADAAMAAVEIGFPVVMKIVSPDIQHKSEVGGVLLNVADRGAAEDGYRTLMARVAKAAPGARLEGVLVAPMIRGGVETILGVMRDPVFGPVVMFGLGGIFVEIFKDVTFRLAPFSVEEARTMLHEIKGAAMLKGARGAPPADEDALAHALAQLSVYAAANADTLESIDVNPFIVLPKGQGAVAVDALIVPRAKADFLRNAIGPDRMSRQPVIVGVADAPTENGGRALPGTTVLSMQRNCAVEALEQAGLTMRDVDGVSVAGMWGMPGPGTMQPILLTEYLGIEFPKWLDGTNVGGSAFVLHAGHAYEAIKAGVCDTVLILYGSMQKSQAARSLGGRPALFSNQFDMVAGLPSPVGAYAMAAHRHMHVYGSTRETLAEIAVSTRKWAALNPAAAFRDPMSMDDALGARMIAAPLGRLDCCLVSDGGGAVVMTTEERARDLKVKPVYVLGHGESATHSNINYMPDMARLEVAERSSAAAYAMAARKPSDIDLAMLYDSFTITVLLTIEALGLCKPGEGKDFVKGQRTAPGGEFPLNTNGGGLSYCHPGMYGIFTMIEAARQLWGICGERQVAGVETAICHGTGGVLSSGGTVILSNQKD